VPQDDGPNPLVPIAYSPECTVPHNQIALPFFPLSLMNKGGPAGG